MYLRTPKRYARRRHTLVSWRRLLIWLVIPVLIFVFIGIYENRWRWQGDIDQLVDNILSDISSGVATVNAPAPTPTLDPTADLQRAEQAWRQGAIQEAVTLYQIIAGSTPNDLKVYYRLALGLIMQGKLDEALAAAEKAITANPFAPDSWSIKAMALNRLDRPEEAIISGLHALELAPEDLPEMAMSRARAQAFLAEAFLNLGQTERAAATVEQALELYPNSFEAYQIRGRINWEVFFDPDLALDDFRQAHNLAPNMIYLGIWLARLEQYGFQNNEIALELYQDIIDKNPGNTQVLYSLADFYLRIEGNYTESVSYLNRCIEADPTNARCYYLMGRNQMQLSELLNAQSSFQQAIDLDPEYINPYWWHAQTNILLNQCPLAIPHLQQGYQLAQEANSSLIGDFEISLSECGAISTPKPEETESV